MVVTRRGFLTWAAGGAFMLPLAMTLGAHAADDKTYVMKIALATLDDALHQYAKNYAAAVEKDFGRAHQGRNLSREPIGLDRATGRGRAIRRDPMPDCCTGISGRHR